ncbi:MAG TPA: HD domain-containing protein [Phycisphaerae bacterium]|nr:HD domain-containing protein [Phycisphaerae bacterium]
MADHLWQRAERDLCVAVEKAAPDPIVWEHSARVARICEYISRLPEIAAGSFNPEALTVAALYHAMGWVLQCRAGDISHRELLLRPTPDAYREMAADWIEIHLKGVVPGGVIERAMSAIRQSGNRRTRLVEAQILADADDLDQIGPPYIDLMIRKCRWEGKTMEQLLTAWQRQEEYKYWEARINESLRFEAVRAIARRRHEALRQFMASLTATIKLDDLAALAKSHREQSPPLGAVAPAEPQ